MLQGSEAPPGSRSDRSGAGRPFRGAGVTLGLSSLTRRVLRRRSSRTAPALSDTTNEGMGKAGIRAAGAQTDAGQGADAFVFGAVLGRPALLLRVRAGNQVKDSFEDTRPRAEEKCVLLPLQHAAALAASLPAPAAARRRAAWHEGLPALPGAAATERHGAEPSRAVALPSKDC